MINKLKRKYDICDNLFKISGVLSKQKQNPLNKFCYSCYLKLNKETLLSHELKTTNTSKIIVEGDKENKSYNNNTKNREDVPEEVSCTKHFLFSLVSSYIMSICYKKLKCYNSRNCYNSCFE